jgi:hypothetical protein
LLDHLVYGGPRFGVKLAIVRGLLGLEAGDPGVTLRGSLRGATGEERGEQEVKECSHEFAGLPVYLKRT